MNKKKRVIALIMALIVVFTTFGTSFAKNEGGVNEDNKEQGIQQPQTESGNLTYDPKKYSMINIRGFGFMQQMKLDI